MWQNMHRPACLALLLALAHCTSGLEVLESDEPFVAARAEEALELTCSSREPWDFCKWTFGGGKKCARAVDAALSPFCRVHGPEDESVRWAGNPSYDGRCSILLPEPALRDQGEWACTLAKEDLSATHTYNVTISAQAKVSFVGRPFRRLKVGEVHDIECQASGGNPAPELAAVVSSIDGPELYDEDLILSKVADADDGQFGGTISATFMYEPSPNEARNSFLKCMAFQRDVYQYASYESSEFEVLYPPLPPESDPVQIIYVDVGLPGEVRLEVKANPAPTDQEVVWHYVKEESNESFLLQAGQEKSRFSAEHVEVTSTSVVAVLQISEVLPEDLHHYCYLEVRNELGRYEYNFKLEQRPPPETTTEENLEREEEKSGSSTGAIVGGVIGGILLLWAIIIGVIFCKKQKVLCFKDSEKTYVVVEPNTNYPHDEVDDDVDGNAAPIIRREANIEIEDEGDRPNIRNGENANRSTSYAQAQQNRESV